MSYKDRIQGTQSQRSQLNRIVFNASTVSWNDGAVPCTDTGSISRPVTFSSGITSHFMRDVFRHRKVEGKIKSRKKSTHFIAAVYRSPTNNRDANGNFISEQKISDVNFMLTGTKTRGATSVSDAHREIAEETGYAIDKSSFHQIGNKTSSWLSVFVAKAHRDVSRCKPSLSKIEANEDIRGNKVSVFLHGSLKACNRIVNNKTFRRPSNKEMHSQGLVVLSIDEVDEMLREKITEEK